MQCFFAGLARSQGLFFPALVLLSFHFISFKRFQTSFFVLSKTPHVTDIGHSFSSVGHFF